MPGFVQYVFMDGGHGALLTGGDCCPSRRAVASEAAALFVTQMKWKVSGYFRLTRVS